MPECGVCGRPRFGGSALPTIPPGTQKERLAAAVTAVRSSAQATDKEQRRHRRAAIAIASLLALGTLATIAGVTRHSQRESLMTTGMMSVNARDYEGGRQYFAQVGSAEAHLLSGAADYAELLSRPELKAQKLEHMKAEMDAATRWRWSYPQATFYLGLYHYEKGDHKQAAEHFQSCLDGLGESPQERPYAEAAKALLKSIASNQRPTLTTQIDTSLLRGGATAASSVTIPLTRDP